MGEMKSPIPIRLPSLLKREISTQCKPCRINRKQETVVCPMKTVGAKSRVCQHTMPAIIAEINSRIDIYLIFDDTRDGLFGGDLEIFASAALVRPEANLLELKLTFPST